MKSAATQTLVMGVDTPILLWIGGILLLIGLFFALVGRRPARRNRDIGAPSDGPVHRGADGEPTATP